jgi:hypothetical protein
MQLMLHTPGTITREFTRSIVVCMRNVRLPRLPCSTNLSTLQGTQYVQVDAMYAHVARILRTRKRAEYVMVRKRCIRPQTKASMLCKRYFVYAGYVSSALTASEAPYT